MVPKAKRIPAAEMIKMTMPAALEMVGFKAVLGGESAGFCTMRFKRVKSRQKKLRSKEG
jgi:hypothetical protein